MFITFLTVDLYRHCMFVFYCKSVGMATLQYYFYIRFNDARCPKNRLMRQHDKVSSHAPQEGPPDLGLTDAAAVGKEVCSWRWAPNSDRYQQHISKTLCTTWFWCFLCSRLEDYIEAVVVLVLKLYIFHVQPTVIIVVPLPRIATIKLWQWWEYKNRALDAEKQCWAVLDWRYLTSWNARTLEVWFC